MRTRNTVRLPLAETKAMRPTERRKAIDATLDEFAAQRGVAPGAVKALKADLERLAQTAIGFDAERGDTITIAADPVQESRLSGFDVFILGGEPIREPEHAGRQQQRRERRQPRA